MLSPYAPLQMMQNGQTSPYAAPQFQGGVAAAAPQGLLRRTGQSMMKGLESPAGMAGATFAVGNTDWNNPKSIGQNLGGLGGALAGQAMIPIPGVGAAVGAMAGGAGGGALGGLFGGDDEAKKAQEEAERKQRLAELTSSMRATAQYMNQQNLNRYRAFYGG